MALPMYFRTTCLPAIYEAEDILRAMPAEQWGTFDFYDPATGLWNMYGLYVREKLKQVDWRVDPTRFTHYKFQQRCSTFVAAVNEALEYITPDSIWGAEAIASGQHNCFPQPHPRDRAMAFFDTVEAKFPRAQFVQLASPDAASSLKPITS